MKSIKKLFYSEIIIFVLIFSYFLISFKYDLARVYFLILAILGLTFLILGIILTIKAKKEKGNLRIFLMSSGISAIAPFLGTILHNLFYGLAIAFQNFKFFFEALHVTFFIISLIVAPILFIIGILGTIIEFNKNSN